MEISYYVPSISVPVPLSREEFENVIKDPTLNAHFKNILKTEDESERQGLIKELPSITWQASFDPEGNAMPSGLFVLEVECSSWGMFYNMKVKKNVAKYGIVYAAMNPQTNWLTLVAKCKPHLHTLLECQTWLAEQLKTFSATVDTTNWDYKTKFVPEAFVLYYDSALFDTTPAQGTIYVGGKNLEQAVVEPETPDIVQAVLITKDSTGEVRINCYGEASLVFNTEDFINHFKSTFKI